MNNNNPFNVPIPNDDDLMNATASGGKREILENGIYYAIITGMEFKTSKSGLPMIVVDFNVTNADTRSVVNIKDYWMLSSSKPEYKPSIYGKLAGLFECWGVPKELRNTKSFTWQPTENRDPAGRLMECIITYSKTSPINTGYVSKLMVRLNIDKESNTYVNGMGETMEGFNNRIKAFVPLDNVNNAPQPVASNNVTNNDVPIGNTISNNNNNNNNGSPFDGF